MIGNVWEWTTTRVRRTPPAGRSRPKACCAPSDNSRSNRQPGAQGRLAPVRAGVLPPVPAGGALAAVAGQRDHAHRVPLRRRYRLSRSRAIADMVTAVTEKYRVILWGVGSIGSELLTAILDHRDDLEVVGVRVYSECQERSRRRARWSAGTRSASPPPPTSTRSSLWTPTASSTRRATATSTTSARLLASGKNVATTVFLFYPPRLPDADRQRLAAACREGNSTFHASGINPGNLSGVLPLALSGMSRTIDKITLQERADMTLYDSTDISFGNMKFGEPLDVINAEVDEYPAGHEVDVRRTDLAARRRTRRRHRRGHRRHRSHSREAGPSDLRSTARAGTTAGQRWNMVGRRDGEPRVEIETLWTVGREYPQHWPAPEHGWTLTIEGDPSMRVHFLTLASFTPQRKHRRARPGGQHRHRHAGAQRRTRGVRSAYGFRDQRDAAAHPQRHRLRER